jgi:hypothetical protein
VVEWDLDLLGPQHRAPAGILDGDDNRVELEPAANAGEDGGVEEDAVVSVVAESGSGESSVWR